MNDVELLEEIRSEMKVLNRKMSFVIGVVANSIGDPFNMSNEQLEQAVQVAKTKAKKEEQKTELVILENELGMDATEDILSVFTKVREDTSYRLNGKEIDNLLTFNILYRTLLKETAIDEEIEKIIEDQLMLASIKITETAYEPEEDFEDESDFGDLEDDEFDIKNL